MKLRSSRGGPAVPFAEAVFRGPAPDGGLYIPAHFSQLDIPEPSGTDSESFACFAANVLVQLLGDEISRAELEAIAAEAFTFAPQLHPISAGHWLLELFHGPTLAFKDFGARFLAATLDRMLSRTGEHALIVVATSGDTGGAVGHAFLGRERVRVAILYPESGVSHVQEKQIAGLGGNVRALRVAGTFDDCQRLARSALADSVITERIRVASANSISIGRLLPQALYYLFASATLRAAGERAAPRWCVPSGNFGNLTAGLLAARWGGSAAGFVAATNANTTFGDYLASGTYQARPSVVTLANAMDVGDPSNFERIHALFGRKHGRIADQISSASATDSDIASVLCRLSDDLHDRVCPHTAAGLHALQTLGLSTVDHTESGELLVTLATAHPAKFGEVIQQACGHEPQMPPRLAKVLDLPLRSRPLSLDSAALRSELIDLMD